MTHDIRNHSLHFCLCICSCCFVQASQLRFKVRWYYKKKTITIKKYLQFQRHNNFKQEDRTVHVKQIITSLSYDPFTLIYNIAGKFVYSNSIAQVCFIFLLCTLMMSANKSLEEKNFLSGWKCYKTIGSYVSYAFINIWSTWEVWRALKKLELLEATPQASLTHISCSPNFLCASYLDERTLKYEPIVN